MTQSASAIANTPNASKYLQQLCKHWSHKAATSFSPDQGTVTFDSGNTLSMRADAEHLSLSVTVPDTGDLTHFQGVVDRHLLRFAFREELVIDWG